MGEQEPGGGGHEKLEDLGIGTWCLALTVGIFARSYLSKASVAYDSDAYLCMYKASWSEAGG